MVYFFSKKSLVAISFFIYFCGVKTNTKLIGDTVELDGETTIDLGAELEIKN